MRAIRLVLGCAVVLLAGCAAMLGPRTIEISEARLQQLVARQFPLDNRWLELLDVTVSAPRVTLLPEANRIGTELHLSAFDRMFKSPLKGSLALNYGLRFEPSDNTLRLADVRVDRFQIETSDGPLNGQMNRVGALLAEQVLKDMVIHTLKPEDIQSVQGRGYEPGGITVTSRGLTFTLHPAPQR